MLPVVERFIRYGIGSGDRFSSEYSGTVAVCLSSLRGNAENGNAGCSRG